VVSTISINRSIDEVFAVLTNVEKTGAWYPGDVEEHWTSPPPHGVGSTRHAVVKMFGRRIENDAVTTIYEPPNRAAMKGTTPNAPFVAENRLDDDPDLVSIADCIKQAVEDARLMPRGLGRRRAGLTASGCPLLESGDTLLEARKRFLEVLGLELVRLVGFLRHPGLRRGNGAGLEPDRRGWRRPRPADRPARA